MNYFISIDAIGAGIDEEAVASDCFAVSGATQQLRGQKSGELAL